ncbi:IS110 family transposase [Duganella sp. FT80W]|uniref:IS110 family transposase n=1 Tax=Duganella guangzhouensis TaxID=2666084 RepID=A0A6I2L5S6_9BURK|nr:IS110 family transposase [Duganella guangzhouensis]MRW92016.1 IS110 family transposase [Duganella guangzhouensis]
MKIIRVGVDLAKNVFQVHAVDRCEKVVWRKKLGRAEWLTALLEKIEPGCVVGMEACGGAHHWARQLQKRGFTVKLIAPQFVKPYVKSNKNDANDAEAICEAMSRPSMRFVAVKSVEQQDLQAIHRIRAELVSQRSAKGNQIRGLCSEFGLVAPREMIQLRAAIQEIEIAASTDPVATRLQQLRGVGPIIATAIVANVGDAKQFSSGRQMAASLGLTPQQNSSGGKERLLGITKRGDAQLRTLLIHGARSVLRTAASKNDRMSRWVTHIAETRHHNIAAVALANKTARIAWAMITKGTDYQPGTVVV